MSDFATLATNPALLSVIAMCVLCLLRCNVLIALFASALLAGVLSGSAVQQTIQIFVNGMGSKLEIALSYILLGFLAVAITQSNIITLSIYKLTQIFQKGTIKSSVLICLAIAAISCLSQNLIPVHIAFIPILIPPLLGVFNLLKIDRRALACALTFGLKSPYIALPLGYGLFFHQTIIEEMNKYGFAISLSDTASVLWIGGLAMLFGLLVAVFGFYRRPRIYCEQVIVVQQERVENMRLGLADISVIVGAVVAFIVQLSTNSMPLGAFSGIVMMILGGGIKWRAMDSLVDSGLKLMGFTAFVMLLAAGFASVLESSQAITQLVEAGSMFVGGKLGGAVLMILLGLFITMGIGSSFGTIPIIAIFYCPLCAQLGFSVEATILLIGIAAAIGDAGSPASDSTIGPTSGLNADGRHDHIWDTCVPTFLAFNVPLLLAGVVGALLLG